MVIEVVEVTIPGRPGVSGVNWKNSAWEIGNSYVERDGLEHNGSSYRAITDHTASALTEPGIGANWATVWSVIALRGEIDISILPFETSKTIVIGDADDLPARQLLKDFTTSALSSRSNYDLVGVYSEAIQFSVGDRPDGVSYWFTEAQIDGGTVVWAVVGDAPDIGGGIATKGAGDFFFGSGLFQTGNVIIYGDGTGIWSRGGFFGLQPTDSPSFANLNLNSAAGVTKLLNLQDDAVNIWRIGSVAGDFVLNRYNQTTGAYIATIFRVDKTTGEIFFNNLTMGGDFYVGLNKIFDSQGGFFPRTSTIANLGTATAGKVLLCSDLGGGADLVIADGSKWKRVNPEGGYAAASTDADRTLTVLASAVLQRYNATGVARNTTWTLSITNAYATARFRIVNASSDTGGPWTMTITGLSSGNLVLPKKGWVDVVYQGSAWIITAYGTYP